MREEGHQGAADDGGDDEQDDVESALVVFAGDVGAAEDGDDVDDAAGDGEQRGLLGCVPQGLDDGGLEGGDGAVGDV